MSKKHDYTRNGRLLRRKFAAYLLPTTLTMAALSLNEFVDSLVISHLLGVHAMAVINLGSPVMLIMAFIYTLLGNGGATLFAKELGERDKEKAGLFFRCSIISAAFAGIMLTLVGLFFFHPLSRLLCQDPDLKTAFDGYLKVVLFSAPFIIIILCFLEFLPPSGIPTYATVINIIANGVNLVMDVVYIRVFHMGVEGAAYATLTGYAVGLIPIIWIIVSRRIQIPKGRWFAWKALKEIVIYGGPSSVVQLGYAMKFAFSNGLAAGLGGTAGVVAFSLCIQSISIASIFLSGSVSAAAPLIAVLHGQRDYYGETTILKSALWETTIMMVICSLVFAVFPRQMAAVYNITEPKQLNLAVHALRIFVICFTFRGICIIIMRYLQSIGNHGFSMFISLFDGCIGIIPISWICSKLLGLDGVWTAYTVSAIVLLVIVIVHNLVVVKLSNGRLTGLLMAEHEQPFVKVDSWTIPEEKPSWLGNSLSSFCRESGLSEHISIHAGLVAEEMVLYTREHAKRSDYMDIIARQYESRVEIDFRSLGDPANPTLPSDEKSGREEENEKWINLKLLRKMADKLEFEYVMGMNCTHAVIGIKTES